MEEVRIKEFGEIYTGKTPPTENPQNFGFTYPFVTPVDLTDYKYIEETERYVSEIGIKHTTLIPENSICVSCIGYIGKIGITTKESCTNQQINSIVVNDNYDPDYVYYLLSYSVPYFKELAGVNVVPQLNKREFSKVKLQATKSKPEQTAIANILSKIDEAIEATQNSIKAAEKLKKALMQNLLTGKLKPDGTWRTGNEFYEDEKFGKVPKGWEIKKGKKIFKSFGSSTLDKVNLSKQGDCIYMKVSDFNIEGNELFIVKANIMFSFDINESLNYCEPNFIVMSKRGEAIRKNRVRLLAKKTLLDPNLMALKIIDGNPLFFKFLLEQMNLQRFLENSALPQLNNKDFYPRYYLYPPIDEQDEISKVLLNQYKSIQSQQTKIRTLQRLKKSLMQNLLTGKVRVDVTKLNELLKVQLE